MFKADFIKHQLNFSFPAGTSRGVLHHHQIYIIRIWNELIPRVIGFGEIAPLPNLSIDYLPNIEEIVNHYIEKFNSQNFNINTISDQYPSIKFGFETALLDLQNGGIGKLFDTDFYYKKSKIAINGLIWMGTKENMLAQVKQKIDAGFKVLKLKIGAINFEDELSILSHIRSTYSGQDLVIRLDANGAFEAKNAQEKLEKLSQYQIHSIEQPVKQGQSELMKNLCQISPIDIALDEELIGIFDKNEKEKLLININPPYIILKPTLLGGFAHVREWITIAEKHQIKWWITSALESAIGLNAIAQLAATFDLKTEQGLGTGGLYTNNFESLHNDPFQGYLSMK